MQPLQNVSTINHTPIEASKSPPPLDYIQPKKSYAFLRKILRAAPDFMTLGIRFALRKIAFKMILPALHKDPEVLEQAFQKKQAFQNENKEICQNLRVKTHDEAVIDGMILFANPQNKKIFESSRAELKDQEWIVCLNGNGSLYEEKVIYDQDFPKIRDSSGANFLFFNYRGVGKSTGNPSNLNDLITDGHAIIEYLVYIKKIPLEKIQIHGWSLGGCIGTQLLSHFDKIALINERSFSLLSKEVKEMVTRLFKELKFKATTAKIVGALAYGLVKFLGLDKNNVKAVQSLLRKDKERRITILYSKLDGVIPYAASLYKGLKDQIAHKKSALYLDKNYQGTGKEKQRIKPDQKLQQRYKNFKIFKYEAATDKLKQIQAKSLRSTKWQPLEPSKNGYHNMLLSEGSSEREEELPTAKSRSHIFNEFIKIFGKSATSVEPLKVTLY